MSLATLKNEYRDLAVKMHEVVSDADLTAAEKRERYEAMDTDLKSLESRIKDAEWADEKAKTLSSILGPDPAADPTAEVEQQKQARSFGQQIVESPAFQDYVKAVRAGGSRRQSAPFEIQNVLSTTDLGADVIGPQRQPGILPILFQRLTVADLMPNGTTTAPLIRYVEETVATNAASTVAEEGEKPEATLDFDTVDEPVRKIAVTLKVSDEMLEDMDQIRSYLDGRLSLFVRIREEQQLLTGAGTGNDLDGFLNRDLTAAQALGADTIAIAVHKELTKVRVASFLDPDAIVFHPNDWQAARLEQDANDQFYGGGPFTGPYGNGGIAGDGPYWGMRVVSTTAMTENTALLGAFATAAQVFRRTGLTVDASNSDGTDFTKNITTLRAEERLALAVYRPAAFGTVTGI